MKCPSIFIIPSLRTLEQSFTFLTIFYVKKTFLVSLLTSSGSVSWVLIANAINSSALADICMKIS